MIDLGQRIETRFSVKLGYNETVVVPDTTQYVPLDKLLGAVLQDKYFQLHMSEFRKTLQNRDPEILSHYFHTKTYQDHPFFSKYPDALALHLVC